MANSVELIRAVHVRCRVDLPDDGVRFRDHVERAAYAEGSAKLAFNPEIPSRAVLATQGVWIRTEHIVIGGDDGEVYSTLTTSPVHRGLQVVLILVACILATAAGVSILSAFASVIHPAYGIVVFAAIVMVLPAIVQASHRFALERWFAGQQRRIAGHLASTSESSAPYRGAPEG